MTTPMLKITIAFFIIFSLYSLSDAESGGKSLYITADYASFKPDDDPVNTYLEVYYSLFRSQLSFQPDSSGYVAIMNFTLIISDSDSNAVDSISWKAGSKISSLSELESMKNYMISDIVPVSKSPGVYKVEIILENGGNYGRIAFAMNVSEFSETQLDISNIELAYNVAPATEGRFVKAGYNMMLNPSRRFSQDDNVIYIYAEGYNFDLSPEADSQYSIEMDIFKLNGDFLKKIPASLYNKPGKTSSIITGFSTAFLKPGGYEIQLILKDGLAMVSTKKQFFILQSPERAKQELMEALIREFPRAKSIKTEEDAKKFRDDIKYISTPEEIDLYESLNLEGKENFQKDFWSYRDPDQSTIINELKLEHYRRLKYVGENYDQYAGVIPGWKTDMGRIYIIYGDPTDIERFPSSIESRGWQRWWYHGIEGGIYFVFIDYEDTDTYDLVHSSKKNEVKDINWESKIKMNIYNR